MRGELTQDLAKLLRSAIVNHIKIKSRQELCYRNAEPHSEVLNLNKQTLSRSSRPGTPRSGPRARVSKVKKAGKSTPPDQRMSLSSNNFRLDQDGSKAHQ